MERNDRDFERLEEQVYTLRVEHNATRLIAQENLKRLLLLEPRVEKLDREAEIDREVTRRVRADRKLVLTVWQKLGGLLVGGIAVTDFVMQLAGHK